MNRLLVRIFVGLIFLLVLSYVVVLVHDNNLHKEEDLWHPNGLGSYRHKGYFKIDPRTILVSLERGDTNVFMPMSGDPNEVEEITDLSIYWTQKDFLKITSTLGKTVWNDPMDLKDWRVYDTYFDANCGSLIGFYSANITYFKKVSNNYVTRLIEVDPYVGLVRWGEESYVSYPQPILQKWVGSDLSGAKTTADDALRLVNEDLKANFKVEDDLCGVMMYSSRFDPRNWYLDVFLGPDFRILYTVNIYTGKIIRKTK